MNKKSRPACIHIVRREFSKHAELGDEDLNSLQEFILPMCFLKANDVFISGKAREISMFRVPGVLQRSRRAEMPSRIPRNASEASIQNMGTCISRQLVSQNFWWLKSITSPT